MEQHELVGLTLQRLISHFRDTPESFELQDSTPNSMNTQWPTIIYRPKIQLNAEIVNDPNNEHVIVVVWNSMINELSCHIYMKAPAHLASAKADCISTSSRSFEKWRSNYQKFERLKRLIKDRDMYKENMNYLKKLSSLFPDAMDVHLFK